MNDSSSIAELWDRIAPDVFRQVVAVCVAAGRGVSITAVPDELIDLEEDEK